MSHLPSPLDLRKLKVYTLAERDSQEKEQDGDYDQEDDEEQDSEKD